MSDLPDPISDAINHLHYRFSCPDVSDVFHVTGFEAVETLNAPYQVRAYIVAASEATDTNELLGHDGHLVLERDNYRRDFYGIIRRVIVHDDTKTRQTATIEMVPALAALGYTRNTRIFQDQTALDVVETVLRESLQPYGRSFDTGDLHRERYLARDYCVQYQETNLDFVHRLLEEEGIGYRFAQDGPESMILFDANAQLERAQTMGDGPVRVEPDYREWTGVEPVLRFVSKQELRPTKLTVRDLDWTSGRPTVEGSADVGAPVEGAREHEVYEHGFGHHLSIHEDHELLANLLTMLKAAVLPFGLPLGLDRMVFNLDGAVFDSFTQSDLAHQQSMRGQLLARDATTFEGIGLVTDFAPGKTFELVGHSTLGFDGEYLITRVMHSSRFTDAHQLPLSPVESGDLQYHNRFECLPLSVPWRPERKTRKPRIYGVQTARVTGPLMMNVHTDAHGRILVKFPWDRAGDRLEGNYTSWIRVGQTWAGGGGPAFMFIPRVGMEVIVSFVDGDPDRPLVTGCVYNGENPTPGFLPVQATKSMIRTRTVPHADGYNELSFEDAQGMERVHIRAQRDLEELVLNDHLTVVGRSQANRVVGDQVEEVGRDQHLYVHRDRKVEISGASTEHVTSNANRSIEGSEHIWIGDDYTIDVSGGAYQVEVDRGECVLRARGPIRLEQNDERFIELSSDEDTNYILAQSEEAYVKIAGNEIELRVGRSFIRVCDHYIQVNGKMFPSGESPGV